MTTDDVKDGVERIVIVFCPFGRRNRTAENNTEIEYKGIGISVRDWEAVGGSQFDQWELRGRDDSAGFAVPRRTPKRVQITHHYRVISYIENYRSYFHAQNSMKIISIMLIVLKMLIM
eukprot:COSAG02_NODE_3619_length_6464_cov_15.210683_1_plen_118_part_00